MVKETRWQRGFTLLEVMVAFVLLTVGVMSTTLIYQVAFKSQSLAQQRLQGIYLAEDLVETVKSIPYKDLFLMQKNPGDPDYIPAGYPADLWEDNQEGYQRCLELSEHGPDMLEIRVTVTWDEGRDSYELTSQVASN